MDYFASTEITDYDESNTRKHLSRLTRMLQVIESLGEITTSVNPESIDLEPFVTRIVEAHETAFEFAITVVGPRDFRLNVDPKWLDLILSNGLKNSCEAARDVDEPNVSIIYGRSEREAWFAIVDNGPGLPPGSNSQLFAMGTSTKPGHLGVGLALSYEAVRALGGVMTLESDNQRTALGITLPLDQATR